MGKEWTLGRFFFAVRGEIDEEEIYADGSYVTAHQHASGARVGEERSIGRSRGGLTTKVHAAADACGNPIDFEITGGEVHDSKIAKKLIDMGCEESGNFVADKAYDSDDIREHAKLKGKTPIIPRRSNSKKENSEFDSHIYKGRHLVENLFARVKHYRGVATRFDKLARNYKAVLRIVFSLIWIRLGK